MANPGDLTLSVYEFTGGPPVDLTSLSIEITNLAGTTVYVSTTSTGIAHPSTGLYTYAFVVPEPGDYLVIWTGTDADDEDFMVSEVISPTAATVVDTLSPWQYQVGDVIFGHNTLIVDTDFEISEPAASTADLAMPGEDGVMMGRDYLQGRTLTWNLVVNARTPENGRERWQALSRAWDATSTRFTPGAVVPVRMRVPGGNTCVAYGRPRKLAASDLSFMRNGAIPCVADFSTVDRFFYDDVEQEISFGIQATIGTGGGVTWPVTWPITWASADLSNSDVIVNAGDAPTWPVITLTGGLVNPVVVFGDDQVRLQLMTTLTDSQSVTIDTRPWARSVVRNDGASLAGAIRGIRLADLALPPGSTLVSMIGIDTSGTASGRVRWRNASTTP